MSISPNLAGIGLRIARDAARKGFRVTEVWPSGPAAKIAIISVDDLLIAVDARSCVGLSTKEVGAMLRGEAGSRVKLTLIKNDGNTKFTVALTREQFNESYKEWERTYQKWLLATHGVQYHGDVEASTASDEPPRQGFEISTFQEQRSRPYVTPNVTSCINSRLSVMTLGGSKTEEPKPTPKSDLAANLLYIYSSKEFPVNLNVPNHSSGIIFSTPPQPRMLEPLPDLSPSGLSHGMHERKTKTKCQTMNDSAQ